MATVPTIKNIMATVSHHQHKQNQRQCCVPANIQLSQAAFGPPFPKDPSGQDLVPGKSNVLGLVLNDPNESSHLVEKVMFYDWSLK